ncbi:hypothetical protein V500_02248 [Pseudogymnoascus sp. VKM F-4518 (FW-2643)]|nr:hypothetical protein V500_02248 [Pseudogymnoascus sp. VKM F-4518 (FW-2643)]
MPKLDSLIGYVSDDANGSAHLKDPEARLKGGRPCTGVTGTNGNDENDLETRGLCLLSLDGGGVRGLSTLYLLRALMLRLNDERKASKLEHKKPCDVFDLIGGTSTGGLIAIMLGRLEMDVDECIVAYKALMETVFEKRQNYLRVGFRGMIKPKFSSKQLEKAIKSVIECQQVPVDEPFHLKTEDEDSRKCRVFVCAQSKETGSLALLKNYRRKGDDPGEATIWQAALATSAAISFFDEIKIGDRTYIDGAMGANNPARQVQNEASKIWCEATGDLEPLVKCFISLGTGNGGINPISDKAYTFLTNSLTAMATDTKTTETEVLLRWRKYKDTRYFRFNVEQGLQKVGLAEYKEKGLMEVATKDYLENKELRVLNCVTNLRTKKYPPNREFCIEQARLQAQEDSRPQLRTRVVTGTEISELMDRANANLKKPAATVTHGDLINAYTDFHSILQAKLRQQPPATPKELTQIHDKLRSTCLRLSHSQKLTPAQRMTYVHEAEKFGKRAVETAIASQNNNRVVQMEFYLACAKAREIQLRSEDAQFECPTLDERNDARENISVAWVILRSVENLDMSVYDAMAKESIRQLGLNL